MMIRIRTHHDAPPIPGWERLQWQAMDDNGEGEVLGYGVSEAEAVAEMLDSLGVQPVAITWHVNGADVEVTK